MPDPNDRTEIRFECGTKGDIIMTLPRKYMVDRTAHELAVDTDGVKNCFFGESGLTEYQVRIVRSERDDHDQPVSIGELIDRIMTWAMQAFTATQFGCDEVHVAGEFLTDTVYHPRTCAA